MIIDASDYALEDTPWAARAACAGQPADLWFPDPGGSSSAARAVCASCRVRHECLDYALRWRIGHGVWGGTTPQERRRLADGIPRLRRLPPLHGTTSRYHIGCRCGRCTEAQEVYTAENPRSRR